MRRARSLGQRCSKTIAMALAVRAWASMPESGDEDMGLGKKRRRGRLLAGAAMLAVALPVAGCTGGPPPLETLPMQPEGGNIHVVLNGDDVDIRFRNVTANAVTVDGGAFYRATEKFTVVNNGCVGTWAAGATCVLRLRKVQENNVNIYYYLGTADGTARGGVIVR